MLTILKDVIAFWKETWHTNKLLFWMEAAGTMMGMSACTILNFSVKDPNMIAVLTLYVLSAFALAWCSYIRRASFVLVLMSFYAIVSSFGLAVLVLQQ